MLRDVNFGAPARLIRLLAAVAAVGAIGCGSGGPAPPPTTTASDAAKDAALLASLRQTGTTPYGRSVSDAFARVVRESPVARDTFNSATTGAQARRGIARYRRMFEAFGAALAPADPPPALEALHARVRSETARAVVVYRDLEDALPDGTSSGGTPTTDRLFGRIDPVVRPLFEHIGKLLEGVGPPRAGD